MHTITINKKCYEFNRKQEGFWMEERYDRNFMIKLQSQK